MKDLLDTQATIQLLNKQLDAFLSNRQKQSGVIGTEYTDLLSEVRVLLKRGGKRLRPLLFLWAYAGWGGTENDAALKVAASLELFHAGILMHDDIIDRDLTRWNGLNISGVYDQRFKRSAMPDARQRADNYALLAGDCCIDLSYMQLLESGIGGKRLIRAVSLAHETFFQLLGGELLDLHVSYLAFDRLDPGVLVDICNYKTAAYSFCLPFEMAGLIAGMPSVRLRQVRQLGMQLGFAYQLQDDLLGMFGDPEKTGKSTLSDLREGKRTLLMYHTYLKTDTAGRRLVDTILGNPDVGYEELSKIRNVIHKSGAKRLIESTVNDCYQKIIQELADYEWRQPYAGRIGGLCQKLVGRDV